MEGIINNIIGYITEYGLRVITAIVIFVIGRFTAKKITNIFRKLMERARWDVTLIKFSDEAGISIPYPQLDVHLKNTLNGGKYDK